jgi:hypothetical protein
MVFTADPFGSLPGTVTETYFNDGVSVVTTELDAHDHSASGNGAQIDYSSLGLATVTQLTPSTPLSGATLNTLVGAILGKLAELQTGDYTADWTASAGVLAQLNTSTPLTGLLNLDAASTVTAGVHESTVTSGAPFIVASSDQVDGLNTELHSGFQATAAAGEGSEGMIIAANSAGYHDQSSVMANPSPGISHTDVPVTIQDELDDLRAYLLGDLAAAAGLNDGDLPESLVTDLFVDGTQANPGALNIASGPGVSYALDPDSNTITPTAQVQGISAGGLLPTGVVDITAGPGIAYGVTDDTLNLFSTNTATATGDPWESMPGSYIVSGLTVTAGSGLTASVATGKAYIPGVGFAMLTSPATPTVVATNDNYIDWDGTTFTVHSGTIGFSPSAPASNVIRLANATTNGTGVTSVTMISTTSINLSSRGISAYSVTAPTIDATNLTATNLTATDLTATQLAMTGQAVPPISGSYVAGDLIQDTEGNLWRFDGTNWKGLRTNQFDLIDYFAKYGGAADGATDSTDAVQACLNDMSASPSGGVMIAPYGIIYCAQTNGQFYFNHSGDPAGTNTNGGSQPFMAVIGKGMNFGGNSFTVPPSGTIFDLRFNGAKNIFANDWACTGHWISGLGTKICTVSSGTVWLGANASGAAGTANSGGTSGTLPSSSVNYDVYINTSNTGGVTCVTSLMGGPANWTAQAGADAIRIGRVVTDSSGYIREIWQEQPSLCAWESRGNGTVQFQDVEIACLDETRTSSSVYLLGFTATTPILERVYVQGPRVGDWQNYGVQDGIKLGGYGDGQKITTRGIGGQTQTASAVSSGYGGALTKVYFSRLRRLVSYGNNANSIQMKDCVGWSWNSAGPEFGAIDVPYGDFNVSHGCWIENTYYTHTWRFGQAGNVVHGCATWDAQTASFKGYSTTVSSGATTLNVGDVQQLGGISQYAGKSVQVTTDGSDVASEIVYVNPAVAITGADPTGGATTVSVQTQSNAGTPSANCAFTMSQVVGITAGSNVLIGQTAGSQESGPVISVVGNVVAVSGTFNIDHTATGNQNVKVADPTNGWTLTLVSATVNDHPDTSNVVIANEAVYLAAASSYNTITDNTTLYYQSVRDFGTKNKQDNVGQNRVYPLSFTAPSGVAVNILGNSQTTALQVSGSSGTAVGLQAYSTSNNETAYVQNAGSGAGLYVDGSSGTGKSLKVVGNSSDNGVEISGTSGTGSGIAAYSTSTNETGYFQNTSSGHAVYADTSTGTGSALRASGNSTAPALRLDNNAAFLATTASRTGGTATAPPTDPVGWIAIDIGGTDYWMPYYS